MGVDYGILNMQQLQQQGPKVQMMNQPQNNSAASDLAGLGSLTKGLKSLFGGNSVSTANDAINQGMQSTMQQASQAANANTNITPPTNTSMANSQQGPIQSPSTLLQQNQSQNKPAMPQGAQQAQSGNAQSTKNPWSVDNVANVANQVFADNPTMAKIAATQAVEESNLTGKPSTLATQYNNPFGIKGKGTAGSVMLPTTEYVNGQPQRTQAAFAAYSSPADAFNAYKNLMSTDRYAGVRSAQTPEEGFNALQKAGYATDPRYTQALNNTYNNSVKGASSPLFNKQQQTASISRAANAASQPGATPYDVAQKYMGMGSKDHADVLNGFFSKSMGQQVNVQNTPWCAAFANSVLQSAGVHGTGSLAARSFMNYGTPTTKPSQGDLVVMSRGGANSGLGHVGFYAGEGENGQIKVLGGNQDGKVEIKSFPTTNVLGYRTPPTAGELQAKAQPQSGPPQGAPMGQLASSMRNPQQNAPQLTPQQQQALLLQTPQAASQPNYLGQNPQVG